jgi:hypothetical protein
MSQPPPDAHELAMFTEINMHMRNTEQKHLSISLSYVGILTLAMSLLHKDQAKFFEPNFPNLIIYVLIIIVGAAVYALQHWYRIWKIHYMEICYALTEEWRLPENRRPYWLRANAPRREPSVDNILEYFVMVLNAALVLLVCQQVNVLAVTPTWKTYGPIAIFSFYLLFTFAVHGIISRRRVLGA